MDGSPGQKPADIAGSDPAGRAVLLEVNALRRPLDLYDLIPWELFSAHQMNWLREMASVHALALVALFDETAGRMSLYRIRCPGDFRRPARCLYVGNLETTERMQFRGWRNLPLDQSEDVNDGG